MNVSSNCQKGNCTIISERGTEVVVKSVEHAKRIITSTAMVRFETKEEVKQDPDILKLAEAFDIDLDTLEVTLSNQGHDFPFSYRFK